MIRVLNIEIKQMIKSRSMQQKRSSNTLLVSNVQLSRQTRQESRNLISSKVRTSLFFLGDILIVFSVWLSPNGTIRNHL